MRSYFASYTEPRELELGNTATFFVEAFSGILPLVLTSASAVLTDPAGATHNITAVVTTDGSPSQQDYLPLLAGLYTWVWTVVPNTGPHGVTSGTLTVRDNSAN